jgi:hypothetical protein
LEIKSTKKMDSPTKKISETIAVIIPLLVVCSCIRLITFYTHWNIPIFDYLNPSELLLSFTEPIFRIAVFVSGYLLYVLGLVIMFFLWFAFFPPKSKKTDVTDENSKEEKGFFQKLNQNKWWLSFSYLIVGGFISYFAWYEFETKAAIVFHAFIWAIAYNYFEKNYSTKTKDEFKPIIIALVLTILSFSFFLGRYDWHKAETYPDSYKIMLSDSTTVETNADKIYVGKTNDFYFLYEKSNRQVSIIPSSEVKTIKMTVK